MFKPLEIHNAAHMTKQSGHVKMHAVLYAVTAWLLVSVFLNTATAREEIASPTYAPVIHEKYFIDERRNPDIAYNPAFEPGLIGFDLDNRPFIRADLERADGTEFIAVQKLSDGGQWEVIDLVEAAKSQLEWNGVYSSGYAHEDRIVFDDLGNAYTIIDATPKGSNLRHAVLMFSPDSGATWVAHVLRSVTPGFAARLEFRDGHNVLVGPPPILITSKHQVDTVSNRRLRLLLLSLNAQGGIASPLPAPITVSDNSLLTIQHSGAGNTTVSTTDLVHVVYISYDGGLCPEGGTPALGKTYNRRTRQFSSPELLGCGKTSNSRDVDVHNAPAATLDSDGYIHVVVGSHHRRFLYGRSRKPGTFSPWPSRLEPLGEPAADNAGGGYTYVSLIADNRDDLHVIARYAGMGYGSDRYYFQLVYMKRSSETGMWRNFDNPPADGRPYLTDAHKLLVYPGRNGYTVYRHKLSADRSGRLFLHYTTRSSHFDIDQERAYCATWPEECVASGHLPKDDPDCNLAEAWTGRCWYQFNVQSHSPVLMLSEDEGATWRIIVTDDLGSQYE